MNKIKNLPAGKAVHCGTEEEARIFLTILRDEGYRWNDGRPIDPKQTRWDIHGADTCYAPARHFMDKDVALTETVYWIGRMVEFTDLVITPEQSDNDRHCAFIMNEVTKRTIQYPSQKDITNCQKAIIGILDKMKLSNEDQITLLASLQTIAGKLTGNSSPATYHDAHWN